jgi:hypothetical protein
MKFSLSNFQGRGVKVIRKQLKNYPVYSKDEYFDVGISFATLDDVTYADKINPYVHVVFENKDKGRDLLRFPIKTLKCSKGFVPIKLKKKVLKKIKEYRRKNYLDNLTYIEILAGLRGMKTK